MKRSACVVIIAASTLWGLGCGRFIQPTTQTPPDGVRLLALTAFKSDPSGQGGTLHAFVQPIASDGAQRYRFELYELRPYSANQRGRRLQMWPEIEPGPQAAENPRWRPHLGAYEVMLPVQTLPEAGQRLLLEVTAFLDDGSRRCGLLEVAVKTDN